MFNMRNHMIETRMQGWHECGEYAKVENVKGLCLFLLTKVLYFVLNLLSISSHRMVI